MPDWIDDLSAAVQERGQSTVAKRLGCSPATVHQLRKRKYATSTTGEWRDRFIAEFGDGTLECPILGEIDRGTCSGHRKRPFAATNPIRVRLFRACRSCPNNPDRDQP